MVWRGEGPHWGGSGGVSWGGEVEDHHFAVMLENNDDAKLRTNQGWANYK